jgi:hypothetical protein
VASEFAMKVATLKQIRHEKNRNAGRFRSTFFARGNQPLVLSMHIGPIKRQIYSFTIVSYK